MKLIRKKSMFRILIFSFCVKASSRCKGVLGIAKPVIGTSENMADPDYDVIKMATILNLDKKITFHHNILNTGLIFQIGDIKMF